MFFTQRFKEIGAFQFHSSYHRSFAIFVEKQTVYIEKIFLAALPLSHVLQPFHGKSMITGFCHVKNLQKVDDYMQNTNKIMKQRDNLSKNHQLYNYSR